MRRWWRGALSEIAGDPVLRVYGGLLAFTHVLTFLHWRHDLPMELVLGPRATPICWPFFERCADFRFLGDGGVHVLLWAYLASAGVAVLLFVRRRLVAAAWGGLLAINLFKAAIWLQDYRLRLNQHYMALFVSLAFLFLPGRRRAIRWLIVAFYFWAGTLKLSREWLSGAALYDRPLGVPESLVPAACAYVLVLEMLLVFGLFSRRAWLFWAIFAQLILFHVTSFTVVGFFYPTLMFSLLAIYPLARLRPPVDDAPPPGRRATWAYLGVFSLLQVMPWLFPGDTAITGEGRLFALHMFDARIVCEARATLHGSAGQSKELPLRLDLPHRIQCDPIVYLSVGRNLCKRYRERLPGFTDLDLSLRSRRSSEAELRGVIDVKDFCAADLSYDVIWPNAWIRK